MMSPRILAAATLSLIAAVAQEPSDRYYDAIRRDDIAALHTLAPVNTADSHGTTPLMYAAAAGSVEAMKVLLASGAEVNAKNAFDATALMWCAGDLDKVRLLLANGADVNARSKQGRTPLLLASAQAGNSEVVKLLLDKGALMVVRDAPATPLLAAAGANDTRTVAILLKKGANVNARNEFGDTPLMDAAAFGNIEMVKILLAKGADANAVDLPSFGPGVKNGRIALGSFTPLLLAAAYGGPETVQLLLNAGADVNAKDVRGMTPLMLAIASDHSDPRVIHLLLRKGADPKIKALNGETSDDWSRKFARTAVRDPLRDTLRNDVAAARKPVSVDDAVARSIALLQGASASFLKEGGCVSCHAQNLTSAAVTAAREHGIAVDEAAATERAKAVKFQWTSFEQGLLQRIDLPGGADTVGYSFFQMAADRVPPSRITDSVIHNLVGQQRNEGNWHFGGVARPPMEDGDFSRTALAIRALQLFAPPARKLEMARRIERAAAWLNAASPRTTEDRNMQLLGLHWADAKPAVDSGRLASLMALQRSDGGWAQTPELPTDAYATGQVLYTLHELGIPVTGPAYRRGAAYLLGTQLADGSWYVTSRAPKFQPYFQGGFPHDHDQWISSAATAWAAMGLAYTIGDKQAGATHFNFASSSR